jgi:DNA transformation protein and related proteins
MARSRASDDEVEHIRELFAAFGAVTVRRMFGGAGIYADGVMFALLADDIIYLKADDRTVPDFERERSAPFSYGNKNGTRVAMSYWRLPDRLYDDPDELAAWARQALAAAGRSAVKRRESGSARRLRGRPR